MKIIDYKKCYYQQGDIVENKCACHKRYFKVYIDFEPIIISICKDWFNMRFNEIQIQEYGFLRKATYNSLIAPQIVDEIVIDLFGGYFSNMPKYKSKIGNVNIVLIDRPFKAEYVDALSLLDYFNSKGLNHLSLHTYSQTIELCIRYIGRYAKYKYVYDDIIKKYNQSQTLETINLFQSQLITTLFQILINKKNGTN